MKQIILLAKNYKTGVITCSPTVSITKWSVTTRMRTSAGHLLNKLNGHKFRWALYEDGALGELDYYPVETADRIMIFHGKDALPTYVIVPAVLDLSMLEATDLMFQRKESRQ